MVSTTLLLTLILTLILTVTLVHSEEIASIEQDLQVVDGLDKSYAFEDEQIAPLGRLIDKVSILGLKDKVTSPGLIDKVTLLGLKDKVTSPGLIDKVSSPGLNDKFTSLGLKDKITSPVSQKPDGLFDKIKFASFKPFWSKSNPDTGTGYSSSTVYAFSYENLLIIVAIKALLAFALFGGFGFAPFLGRSLEHPDPTTLGSLLGGTEDLLFTLAFLKGRPEEGYTCLQRQACLRPARGEDILLASGMLEKAVHFVQSWTSGSVSSPHSALSSLEEALDYSYSGGDCRQRYSCSVIHSL